MVVIHEYRVPLPFNVEEYEIAQLYMVAKYSASESSGDNGDGVEILKNEPFEESTRRGQYTHKVYHLASKLPGWLVSLLPKKALILEEEAWNAYPHCTTILKCPFLNKFKLILDSTHLPDRGTSENALKLDPKTLKKRQVEYIDIANDQPEKYVEEEDPTLFHSKKTGRGPLLRSWQDDCEPVMCAYKLVTVDVPYWGFGSRIEKFIAKSAQRKILLEGHRKCFCWLDEWFGKTMADIRRMEHETAEAIKRARTMALTRANGLDECDGLAAGKHDAVGAGLGTPDPILLESSSAIHREPSHPGTPRVKVSPLKCSTGHRPSLSLAGPQSFSVGTTIALSSELDQVSNFSLGGSAAHPHASLVDRKSSEWAKQTVTVENLTTLRQTGSRESFNASHLHSEEWDVPYCDSDEESSPEVARCVDVLDRVIAFTKLLRLRKGAKSGTFGTGIVAPVDSSGEMPHQECNELKSSEDVEDYLGVLNSALRAVKVKPSKSKLL